jgi:hypothetical protein
MTATTDTTAVLLGEFDRKGEDKATMRKIIQEILVALNGS